MANIPDFLTERLISQYGEETTNKIIEGYKIKRKSTFRVNTIKTDIEKVKAYLESNNIKYEIASWYDAAIILKEVDELTIKQTSLYENGEIYLQSLSSMIPPIIVTPKVNENILDMTAAPGGKTTQMYALSEGRANITACEKNKIRAERLKYNIEKQGATRIGVLMQDARRLDSYFSFDKILLDAPCSGSGTLYLNDEKTLNSFNKDLVERSIKVQKELLNKALKHIKIGHEIVYSTCSILREENESHLKELIEKGFAEIVPIDVQKFSEVPMLPVDILGTICVCPTELYEGFFVAKLRKLK